MNTDNTLSFTKKNIDSIPTPLKRVRYKDKLIPGLILEVFPSGERFFRLRKKLHSKDITHTIGRFPDITPEQARRLAEEARTKIASGRIPSLTNQIEELKGLTLQKAIDEFLKHRKNRIKQRTAKNYVQLMHNFTLDWMDRPISDIKRRDIKERHYQIGEIGLRWCSDTNKKIKVRPSQSRANEWARTFRAIYTFCRDHFRDDLEQTVLPENPVFVLSSMRLWYCVERKNTRIRNKDLGRWLEAVDLVQHRAELHRNFTRVAICDALRFALFTGLRRSEVFRLTWDRVNLPGGYFWISETKNGQVLELPITNTLREILQRRNDNRHGSSWVFPHESLTKPINDPKKTIWEIEKTTEQLSPEEGLIPFRCHDARRTYGSLAEQLGLGTYTIKRLMNHKTARSADVTQGYIVFSAEELKLPAERVEKFILELSGRYEPDADIEKQMMELFYRCGQQQKRKIAKMLSLAVDS